MKEKFSDAIVPAIIIVGAVVTFVSIAVFLITDAHADSTTANDSRPFDHSVCQYPYRASNPADGCDNSDPADPTAVKGEYAPVISDGVAPAASHAVVPDPTPVKKGCYE